MKFAQGVIILHNFFFIFFPIPSAVQYSILLSQPMTFIACYFPLSLLCGRWQKAAEIKNEDDK